MSTATVSAVINDSAFVRAELRGRVTAAVAELDYHPMSAARTLRRGRSHLIALVVSDLSNPFYGRVLCTAEAAVASWGSALLVFNSDEQPERERRILARVRALSCDGVLLVPVSATIGRTPHLAGPRQPPTVLFGRELDDDRYDSVTLDNVAAAREVTSYLLDLGHRAVATVTGPAHVTTGRFRLDGFRAALATRGLTPSPDHVRSGEFREDVAYSVAREMLSGPARPTAIYAANGLMALGVLRALADLGLRCPEDVSIASTDTVSGDGALRPRLTRTEHPSADMTNEALRLLFDRVERRTATAPRHLVFQPALILGETCRPLAQPTRSRGAANAGAAPRGGAVRPSPG